MADTSQTIHRSILVGYYQDGELLYAAKLQNGPVSNTRREVAAKLKGLQIDTCPSPISLNGSARNRL